MLKNKKYHAGDRVGYGPATNAPEVASKEYLLCVALAFFAAKSELMIHR